MSYTLTQAKDLVINQGYAIKNDDSVEKLREVLNFCFTDDRYNAELYSRKKYFYRHKGLELKLYLITDEWHGNSINLSEIELPKQINSWTYCYLPISTKLIAKSECDMSDGSGKALIIGKEYIVKTYSEEKQEISIESELFPSHLFSTNKNDKSNWKHFFNISNNKSINLSEIELPKQITIEMVIELTKKYTNDMELGSKLRKLLNN